MSKIIIVGHNSVKIESIVQTLEHLGVEQATFSGKTPVEIDQIINTLSRKANEEEGRSSIPKIWDGLALQLMLDNIDKPIWGWSNSEALYTLDYWKNIDPSFTFVFAYDSPASVLLGLGKEVDIDLKLNEWVTYNRKLLNFYLDNKERSVLLNQTQFNRNKNIGVELLKCGIKELCNFSDYSQPSLIEERKNIVVTQNSSEQSDNIFNEVELYLVNNVINEYYDVVSLYEELQSVADLPLDIVILPKNNTDYK